MRETARASQAFNDYLGMGEERSLEKLLARYRNATDSVPTVRLMTLKNWSRAFGWQARLAAIKEQERQSVIAQGITLKQNRLDAYNDLFDRCKQVIEARAEDVTMTGAGSETGLLVRGYKAIGSGEFAEKVEEYSVDTGLIREMRELAKQAAIEMGQWTERGEQRHGGLDGGPIEHRITIHRVTEAEDGSRDA